MLINTLECVLSLFVTGFPRNLASLLLVFNDSGDTLSRIVIRVKNNNQPTL